MLIKSVRGLRAPGRAWCVMGVKLKAVLRRRDEHK